jgi:transposase
MAFSINSKMAVTGVICKRDFPPYSTVYWHSLQWQTAGVFEQLMGVLHEQVRQQVKKNRSGRP